MLRVCQFRVELACAFSICCALSDLKLDEKLPNSALAMGQNILPIDL